MAGQLLPAAPHARLQPVNQVNKDPDPPNRNRPTKQSVDPPSEEEQLRRRQEPGEVWLRTNRPAASSHSSNPRADERGPQLPACDPQIDTQPDADTLKQHQSANVPRGSRDTARALHAHLCSLRIGRLICPGFH